MPFINPRLAEELGLKRPARDWTERLFRLSAGYCLIYGLAWKILPLFVSRRTIESDGGDIGRVLGITFGLCAFYALNFLVWRFVNSRVVKFMWWGLLALIAAFCIFLKVSIWAKNAREQTPPAPAELSPAEQPAPAAPGHR